MKHLFEYLISKENKKKVTLGAKYSLRTGDIVLLENKVYYIYVEDKDRNGIEGFPPIPYLKNNSGYFVTADGWLNCDDYDDALRFKSTWSVKTIYKTSNNIDYDWLKENFFQVTSYWMKKTITRLKPYEIQVKR